MDSSTIAIITGIVTIAGGILTLLNRKHIKSKCCKKELIEIDNSSPINKDNEYNPLI
jgi:hypothetical protein